MDYCGPRGLPHSTFKTWDQLDQLKALAWSHRQSEKCPEHGIHPEVFDPERGGDPEAMVLVSGLRRCCEIAERQREQFEKERMPGEHQVWKHQPPPPDPAADLP